MMDPLLVLAEILRSQINDIHHTLETVLLSRVRKKRMNSFKLNETRVVSVNISVTCIDAGHQTLVVEDISRLLSLAQSLESSVEKFQLMEDRTQ